jgi:phosphoglycerate dehydrogenase-like enzyme
VRTRSRFQGFELRGRTLGIIGLGRIGRAVAERAAAFGMRIVGVDPNVSPDALGRLPVALVSLAALLAEADVITIHVPLAPETHHLLDRAAIAQLKRGVVVLNVARGGVVDEAALADALREGRVAAAGVDVFEHEPPAGSPLLEAPNVILTPHVAASTAEAQTAVGVEVAQRILEVLEAVPAGS